MAIDLTSFKALSFDIYGTLIDWETGIHESLLPLLYRVPETHSQHQTNSTPTEQKHFLLETYIDTERSIQTQNPTLTYSIIVSKVYLHIATQILCISATQQEADAFSASIGLWPAFPDTINAMHTLSRHYKLIALSNVDRTSFAHTLSVPLSTVPFNAIYTAQDIGSYKPSLQNYEYLIQHASQDLEVTKDEILVVAVSLRYDHVPASKIGLRPGVWIMRDNDVSPTGGRYEDLKNEICLGAEFRTLGEFADAVEKAFAAKERP